MASVLIKLFSLRTQLLWSFIGLIIPFLACLVIILFFWIKLDKLNYLRNKIENFKNDCFELINTENSFFLLDVNTNDYHKNYTSQYSLLFKYQKDTLIYTSHKIKSEISNWNNNELDSHLDLFNNKLKIHLQNLDSVVEKLNALGFKDYGIEGKMRELIHSLEDSSKLIDLNDILSLRRHEKDFILRKDVYYLNQHRKLCNEISIKLAKNKNSYAEQKILDQYCELLEKYGEISLKLGTYDSNGYYKELRNSQEKLIESLSLLSSKSDVFHQNLSRRLVIIVICFATFISILALFLSFRLAKHRAKPMEELVQMVKDAPEIGKSVFKKKIHKQSREHYQLKMAFYEAFNQLDKQLQLAEQRSKDAENQNVELQKVNQELDQFVYSISHDMRAPLTSVMGLIELAKQETNPDDAQALYTMMLKSVHRLDKFIKDLLNYSRNARFKIEKTNIDFAKIIDSIFEQYETYNSKINFNKKIQIIDDGSFTNDYYRLNIVLSNIIDNSIKYLDINKLQSEIKIDVQVKNKTANIVIKDNGIGIPFKYQPLIFNMFYRASDLSTGSGLGLYIVKETIAKIKGSIQINSKQDEGTEVILNLQSF